MNTVLTSIALVCISTLVIGTLAYVCATRRSVVIFVVSVVLAWAIAACAIGYYSQITSLTPDRIPGWRRYIDSLLSIAPLVLLPAAFAVAAVLGKVRMHRIPLLTFAGAALALPFTFMTALASSCYVALDCP
jgi:hypothetical protein